MVIKKVVEYSRCCAGVSNANVRWLRWPDPWPLLLIARASTLYWPRPRARTDSSCYGQGDQVFHRLGRWLRLISASSIKISADSQFASSDYEPENRDRQTRFIEAVADRETDGPQP